MATLPVWPASAAAAERPTLDWIFEDPRSRALLAEVEQVAPSDASVLISGETGTGKELIARHLHNCSARRDGPFVIVSCGAFSEALVDAELFGHENGAFAGAFGAQAGWFEKASGGTIFLDEVNDLPLSVQNKLLRVLQERAVVRLGGSAPIAVDLRVVAATTLDLEALVRDRRFRKDLYYRLNVVHLNVLTLRERPADIVPLARYFIDGYCRRLGYPRPGLSPEAERRLVQAPWSGNVRELENAIHRSLLLCDGPRIEADDLRLPQRAPALAAGQPEAPPPLAVPAAAPAAAAPAVAAPALREAIRQLCEAGTPGLHQAVEDTLYREVFRYCHYSQSEAARLLGVSRNIVRTRLIRLGEIAPPRKPGTTHSKDTDHAI